MSTQASALFRMSSLFLGIFFLMLGMMLLGMGLAIKVPSLYGEGMSGIILSIHYVGLIVGAIRSRDLIDRVGHIRAFAAYATILSAAVIFHALVEDQFVWMLLRLIFGLCFGGLVAIFESWISDAAEPSKRGFVVSFYQFVTYFGQALGMLCVNLVDIDGNAVFLMASVVLSVSLVPIVLTRLTAPAPEPFKPKGFRELFEVSPLALTGAIGSGLILGTLYALTSVYLVKLGVDTLAITLINVAIVAGATLFQIPLALVADRVDRRVALLSVFVLIGSASAGALLRTQGSPAFWELCVWFFVIGGGTAMIYPIALARAYDYLKPEKYVAAASAMVMAYSAAAFVGPAFGGILMQQFGVGLFLPMMVAMASIMALFTVYRMIRGESMSVEDQEEIVVMPTRLATAASLALDPRTPDQYDELGEGEEDMLSDTELMGERYDPTR